MAQAVQFFTVVRQASSGKSRPKECTIGLREGFRLKFCFLLCGSNENMGQVALLHFFHEELVLEVNAFCAGCGPMSVGYRDGGLSVDMYRQRVVLALVGAEAEREEGWAGGRRGMDPSEASWRCQWGSRAAWTAAMNSDSAEDTAWECCLALR